MSFKDITMQGKQVFQAINASRWQRIKWTSRLLIFIFVLFIVAFGIAVGAAGDKVNAPRLQTFDYKPLRDTQSFIYKNSELARKYYGFRKFIDDKEAGVRKPYQAKLPADFRNISKLEGESLTVRSAFFVDWDPQ